MNSAPGVIRVLVVDDSAFVRKVVRQMLTRSPFIEVVGVARDGQEALEMVESLKPDVVTLDLVMPVLDGVGFLRKQMERRPIPVVVCSISHESGAAALEALEAGAVDFVQKPTALATERIFEIADELIAKIKAAATVRPSPPTAVVTTGEFALQRRPDAERRADIVVIGVSTGGPQALRHVIPAFPQNLPVPVVIVLHMPVGYTAMYAQRLNELTALDVREAEEGSELRPGEVLLAPAGRHLTLHRDSTGRVRAHLDIRPMDKPHRPSVDVLFGSAAAVYENRVLGVVMTGMGNDGTAGAGQIREKGGRVLTEDESTCVVYGMPRAVVEAGWSDRTVPLDRIAETVLEML